MKIITGYLLPDYVKEDEWPDKGELYVSLDIQNRLGPQTWLVAIAGDGLSQEDAIELGLFWRVGIAVDFLLTLEHNPEVLKRCLKHAKKE